MEEKFTEDEINWLTFGGKIKNLLPEGRAYLEYESLAKRENQINQRKLERFMKHIQQLEVHEKFVKRWQRRFSIE